MDTDRHKIQPPPKLNTQKLRLGIFLAGYEVPTAVVMKNSPSPEIKRRVIH
jgi:hypothetical protein